MFGCCRRESEFQKPFPTIQLLKFVPMHNVWGVLENRLSRDALMYWLGILLVYGLRGATSISSGYAMSDGIRPCL